MINSWRLLIDPPGSPAWNMAVDEALLREVAGPVLRLYEWSVPAVSLGYFQASSLVPEGRPFVRRYTGGGLVDHAHDVTYTVVLPRAHPWMELSAPESYAEIHRGVQAALAAGGVESELTPSASESVSEACFQKPVRFDLVSGQQKISGAAQRRTREGLLHQGSILLENPERNAGLRRDFSAAFAARLGLELSRGVLTESELGHAQALERERYATPAWNGFR